jgi:HlyD family secretion protein
VNRALNRTSRRGLFLGAVATVFAGLVWVAVRDVPVVVETAVVTRGPIAVRLREQGQTRVEARHLVAAPLDGYLHRVLLKAGDELKAGVTVLARIEPLAAALLDERSRALAEARVAAGIASVAAAREREVNALALLGAAEEDLGRLQRGGAGISEQAIADARRQVLFHGGELASARAAIAVAEAELVVARAALDVTATRESTPSLEVSNGAGAGAKTNDAVVIMAPIDGRVLAVRRESEGPVRIGEPILELADVRALEVVADYLTTDAVRMTPGMEARAVGWGGGDAFSLRVRRVEPLARTKVSALGVEEQRVDVVLDLVDPRTQDLAQSFTLGDGFRVHVEVLVARAQDAVLLPEAALVRTATGWGVYVLDDQRARFTEVAVGLRDGAQVEVVRGPSPGSEVIVFPSEQVVDGARVRRR